MNFEQLANHIHTCNYNNELGRTTSTTRYPLIEYPERTFHSILCFFFDISVINRLKKNVKYYEMKYWVKRGGKRKDRVGELLVNKSGEGVDYELH